MQYLYFLTMEPLQRVENDIARKNYVPSSSKNSCPGIKSLNHIESEPVKVFVINIWSHACPDFPVGGERKSARRLFIGRSFKFQNNVTINSF